MAQQGLRADLIVTDPPYLIRNTKAGGKSRLSKSIQNMNDQIAANGLTAGISEEHLEAMMEAMQVPNIYCWCNGAQIQQYLNFFVEKNKCSFDVLIWHKTNAMPLYHNKYLSDKEYILYFRRGGFCMPESYADASTVYTAPINAKDKKLYGHPTIKPLPAIQKLIRNSSKEDQLILDPFAGSGTTPVAAKSLNRNFVGFEIEKRWYDIAQQRLKEEN